MRRNAQILKFNLLHFRCPKISSVSRHTATATRSRDTVPLDSPAAHSTRRNQHRRHFHPHPHALQLVSACDRLARTCPSFTANFSAGIYNPKYWHDGLGPWRRLLPLAQCAYPLVPSVPQFQAFFFGVSQGGGGVWIPVTCVFNPSVQYVFCSWYCGRLSGIACRQGPDVVNQLGRSNGSILITVETKLAQVTEKIGPIFSLRLHSSTAF